jgi:hypothetical protein
MVRRRLLVVLAGAVVLWVIALVLVARARGKARRASITESRGDRRGDDASSPAARE